MGEASRRKKEGSYLKLTVKTPEGVLQWSVLGDLGLHSKGAALIEALASLNESLNHQLGGKSMTVLLETSDGRPVLEAQVEGLSAWMSVIGVFQDQGLTDRLEDDFEHVGKYDAIFS
jgi:hypothetical protein